METIEDITVRTPDGRDLAAQVAGPAGAPLVLVHEGTPSRGVLDPAWVEVAVAAGLRTAAYSRPGYRWSTPQPGRRVADAAADSAAVADTLGADTFSTWGVSGGGPHALACSALLGERVTATALLASVGPADADGLDWTAGMGRDNVDESAASRAGEVALRANLEAQRSALADPDAELDDTMATLLPPPDLAYLADPAHRAVIGSVTGAIEDGIEGWLEDDLAFATSWGFDLPSGRGILLLLGGLDLMVPPAHGHWLAAAMPEAALRLLPEHGHLSLLTRYDDVANWLVAQRLPTMS